MAVQASVWLIDPAVLQCMRGVGVGAGTDAWVCVAQHHKKKTLNPTWNEHFHLLVQEPKTQAVRLQVYDWDGIHLKASIPSQS